jgi:hypothetical protein
VGSICFIPREIKKDSALIKAEITVENDLYEIVEAMGRNDSVQH